MREAVPFRAASIREAMDAIAQALGREAVVVRTRRLPSGEFEVWARPGSPSGGGHTPAMGRDGPPSASTAAQQSGPPTQPAQRTGRKGRGAGPDDQRRARRIRDLLAGAPDVVAMLHDVELLRHAAAQRGRRSSDGEDPLAAPLEAAGIEPTVARAVAARARARAQDGNGVASYGAVDLEAELARVVRTVAPPWKTPGRTIVALVGPPGAGCTTVAARVAAEAAFRAQRSVALVSVDPIDRSPWVLEAFAEALGLPHERVARPGGMAALAARRREDVLVVDVASGNGPCDAARHAVGAMLDEVGAERHLVLPVTWSAERLCALVRASEAEGIASLVLTRLDEAATLGPMWSVLWRHPHPVAILSEGQEVPGGLAEPCGLALARRTLRQPVAGPTEPPLALTAT